MRQKGPENQQKPQQRLLRKKSPQKLRRPQRRRALLPGQELRNLDLGGGREEKN